jgi:hypothetical protein
MQLAWSPDVAKNGQAISVATDGQAVFTYTVAGSEKMGNGQPGTSGPGAAVLYATKDNSGGQPPTMPLPQHTLTVSGLFPGETVVFPFASLTPALRQTLSTCFTK